MKALRYENGELRLADVPQPARPDEALVRVTLSGICNTDLEITRGYAGFEGTIGHEFVGVAETAPGAPHLVGKRVVGEINAGCGECRDCLDGDPRHCATRTVLGIVGRDGAHAEYLQLPARNLLAVPDDISDEQAVFTEPLAAAYGILERVDVGADARVAVIGDGKLGLLCAMSLARSSKKVTLVGKHPEKIAIAEKYGVQGMAAGDIPDTASRQFDIVVEASGSESGFASAVELVKPRGTIVLKSTFHGTPVWPAARIVVDEITIVGSRCGRFAPALDLIVRANIDVGHLIDAQYPLADAVSAMERASRPGALKVLLKP